LGLRALWRAWRGDVEGACEDCLSLQKSARYLEGQGLLVEQLVGIAIEALAHDKIQTILDRTDVSSDLLEGIQAELQEQFRRQEVIIDLTAEKIFLYDYIQKAFTDDGQGHGRPLKMAVPLVVGDWKAGLRRLVTFSYPGRRETMQMVNAFYDEVQRSLERMPWQAGQDDDAERLSQAAEDSFLLSRMASSHVRLGSLVWRLKTGRRALVAILAVLRYRKDNDAYPDGLDTLLAEGYLTEIPIDPYSGKPLAYRKTADGFLLYSWGDNLQDDGGKLGTGYSGRPRMYADNGDWVFWPVPQSEK